jgi:hypothetical protein
VLFSNGFKQPLVGGLNQLAVAMEFIDLAFMAWQSADHGFTAQAKPCNGGS